MEQYLVCLPELSVLVPHPHPLPHHLNGLNGSVVGDVYTANHSSQNGVVPGGQNGMGTTELGECIIVIPVQGRDLDGKRDGEFV